MGIQVTNEEVIVAQSKTHELAWSIGLAQGCLSCILIHKEDVEWFRQRGITPMDLDNLKVAIRNVANAFYREPEETKTLGR